MPVKFQWNPVPRQLQEIGEILQKLIVKIHRIFNARGQDMFLEFLSSFERRIPAKCERTSTCKLKIVA